jgi:hypothetical protein
LNSVLYRSATPAGPGGVFPHPGREPLGELFLLLPGGGGGVDVEDAPAVDVVGDAHEPLVEAGLEQPVGRHALGPPVRGHGDGPALPGGDLDGPGADALGVPDARVVGAEDLGHEGGDVTGFDPAGAGAYDDLVGPELGGLHRLQRGDVAGEPLIALGRLGGRGELGPDVAGQVVLGGHQRPAGGVDEHVGFELGPGLVDLDAQQGGDPFQVDPAALVKGDGQGLVRGVGTEAPGRGVDGAALQDRRSGGGVEVVVIDLDRRHGGPVGVGPEPAQAGREPPQRLLAGGGVDAPGAGPADPVEGTPAVPVALVAVPQRAAAGLDVGAGGVAGLEVEQVDGGVPQRDQGPDLVGRAFRDLPGAQDPVLVLVDDPALRDHKAALAQRHPPIRPQRHLPDPG